MRCVVNKTIKKQINEEINEGVNELYLIILKNQGLRDLLCLRKLKNIKKRQDDRLNNF